jgi:hypothetical protein
MHIEGKDVRIIEGVSGLAALDAIKSAKADEYVAILTDLSLAELGTPVVLDIDGQRIADLDEWGFVPTLFGVRDGGVTGPVRDLGSWVPRMLLSLRHGRTYPPAVGGILTAEHVTRSLLLALLGVDRIDELELSTALTPLDDDAVRARLGELDPVEREGIIRAVSTYSDPHLAMALRAATLSGRVSVIAVGLVVAELWDSGGLAPDPEVAGARARIERYIGKSPSSSAARRFGEAARLLAKRWLAADDHHVRDVFDQAEAICDDIGWSDGAAASDLLPAGLKARVKIFAEKITSAVAGATSENSLAVDAAYQAIQRHGAKSLLEHSLATARMATRLVRWLHHRDEQQKPVSFAAAVADYGADGAWADRALGDLWDGDTDPILAEAYRALALAVQASRRGQDAAVASVVSGDLIHDDAVTPVEDILSRLVVPLAAHRRVLLVVLDGMSVPTAVELASELGAMGWTEIVRAGGNLRRDVALAALPTITEYSRTSLFAGQLLAGNQGIEKPKFAAAVNGVVFHKDNLRSEAGHALPATVSNAISSTSQKIVATVLNTIDDALASADVDAMRWSVRSIANLVALLNAAHEAGRIVILTSDHGHIVERGSELRNVPEASARWRTVDSGPPQDDEILVSGPRVLAPGGKAILAVSDGLRYTSKKAGYHGGASLAELAIPIIVLKPRSADTPANWVEAPPQEPTWWNEPSRIPAVEELVAPPKRPRSKPSSKSPETVAPTLFDAVPAEETAEVATSASLASRLIASARYAARLSVAGRHPIDEDTAETVITALIAGNGRAHRDTLAAAAGVPAHTFSGLLASLRRILNVDGYPVVDVDADQVTVLLDVGLLREQFGLGGN